MGDTNFIPITGYHSSLKYSMLCNSDFRAPSGYNVTVKPILCQLGSMLDNI